MVQVGLLLLLLLLGWVTRRLLLRWVTCRLLLRWVTCRLLLRRVAYRLLLLWVLLLLLGVRLARLHDDNLTLNGLTLLDNNGTLRGGGVGVAAALAVTRADVDQLTDESNDHTTDGKAPAAANAVAKKARGDGGALGVLGLGADDAEHDVL